MTRTGRTWHWRAGAGLLVLLGAMATGAAAQPVCSGDATALKFPLDGSYAIVPISGGVAPQYRNDDGSSAAIPLGFTYDLYGDLYTSVYVNNNGNLSFVTPYGTYTASGFPSGSFQMVAPFWADVDTRAGGSGLVWMKQYDSNADTIDDTLVVTWDNVGYFGIHDDLLSTFQVAISDGSNPAMGIGNNVCFSWDKMCWTTGDASGGSGGFGGVPATVGANRGDGVDYFQIGRFDHAGADYDGPGGNADGVNFLDHSSTCFSTATSTSNISPIPQGAPVGNTVTIDACQGGVLDLDLLFLSPEAGQTTTVGITDVDGAQVAGLSIGNVPGNVATVSLDWTPDAGDVGSYVLQFAASDDFVPPGVTNVALTIDVICTSLCGNGQLDPMEECDPPGSITCPAGSPASAFLGCGSDCLCPIITTTTTTTFTTTSTVPCVPEVCDNTLDDDCDGLIDCDDPECDGISPCPPILHDPSVIKFGPAGRGLDLFKSHGRVEPGHAIDVANSAVGWVISNARGEVYRGILSPGDLVGNRAGTTFKFLDKPARFGKSRRSGIYKATIKIKRGGTSYGYKVQAYADLSAATDENMTIQFYIGVPSRAYAHAEAWRRTATGWKASGFLLQ